jgi:MSHA pilin protein MshC
MHPQSGDEQRGRAGERSAPFSFVGVSHRADLGFSLPELIAVLVVLGVIAVAVGTNLSGSFATTRGFYEQVFAQVSFGRKAAIAQRRAVFVRIDATQSRLCYSSAGACSGADAVAPPSGPAPFAVSVPAGVSITAAVFQFDPLGRYLTSAGGAPGGPLVISVSGEGTYQIVVEHDTGYVHP